MSKCVSLICSWCDEPFDKEKKEYTRRIKLGKTEFYCSLSCGMSANNSTPERIKITASVLRKRNEKQNKDPKIMSLARYNDQKWRYVKLEKYLNKRNIVYKFEYPLLTATGNVRLYDLALRDTRLLIEFDEGHHKSDYAQIKRDKEKDKLAKKYGWSIIRLTAESNTVFKARMLKDIIL